MSQFTSKLTSREAACWLRLGCWSNNVANSHLSPGAFNCRILRSCLVLQGSYPLRRPHHQRRLANCDRMPASYTSGQPFYSRRHQPAELRHSEDTLSLGRRARKPGHLLHSAIIRPLNANSRRLRSRHPFVPAEQQLISFSDNNNIRAAQWGDHQHRHPPTPE